MHHCQNTRASRCSSLDQDELDPLIVGFGGARSTAKAYLGAGSELVFSLTVPVGKRVPKFRAVSRALKLSA
jgi:hypothetical protein